MNTEFVWSRPERQDCTKEIKSASRKTLVKTTLFPLAVIIVLSGCLFLSACSSPAGISGAWIQETENGEKALTVSDSGDSYSLVCPDGTAITGAIYRNDEYSGPGKAYDFYLEAPSVMTSDVKLNETKYKQSGLVYETMYFTTSADRKEDTTSGTVRDAAAAEDASKVLEGNGASDGNKTILDGIWRKR